ncbi:GNAT family N-acetyltransferase [Cryobacterium sp. Sr8]|uniref:GNAT family N-acetyltransferase n=1 Tax=Cryobacterium sp. Sr8 TaxID=1259203 RepID=UPI0010699D82|nr:GNAT family N-acetyltransferase [Cryobacterium sp. Sr8]TFD78999.1 GNAT family N-acetyltransferase [Cryobacterium sp. Sr8]
MSVQVRPLGDKDFFSWLGLFEGYSEFYKSELTDEKALRVWSWIIDKGHDLTGAVALNDEGEFIGFAHYRAYPRTLTADRGLFLDDLFVVSGKRGAGVGKALIEFSKTYAGEHHLKQLQWLTAADNKSAQKLYDEVATRTSWVTYEIEL